MEAAQIATGFAVGTIIGLTGVGGGSLMTPLLIVLFGIPPTTAVGTDLLYAAATKMGSTCVHARKKNVDWLIVRRLAAGSFCSAILTFLALYLWFPHQAVGASQLMTVTLGIALLLTAISLVYRTQLQHWAKRGHSVGRGSRDPLRATVICGVVLGVLVSLSSVGAGALAVTMLLLLYPLLETRRIVGTDLAHAVPLTLVAGLGHWWLGNVSWTLLLTLLLGSIPGGMLGSYLTQYIPEKIMRSILASLLMLASGKMILAGVS